MYLDDLSGNTPMVVFDTIKYAITTITTIKGLTSGSSYKATVKSVNAIGDSFNSNILNIHAGTVPSKIMQVALVSSSTSSIKFEWENSQSNGGLPISKYSVYLDVGQTGTTTHTI